MTPWESVSSGPTQGRGLPGVTPMAKRRCAVGSEPDRPAPLPTRSCDTYNRTTAAIVTVTVAATCLRTDQRTAATDGMAKDGGNGTVGEEERERGEACIRRGRTGTPRQWKAPAQCRPTHCGAARARHDGRRRRRTQARPTLYSVHPKSGVIGAARTVDCVRAGHLDNHRANANSVQQHEKQGANEVSPCPRRAHGIANRGNAGDPGHAPRGVQCTHRPCARAAFDTARARRATSGSQLGGWRLAKGTGKNNH